MSGTESSRAQSEALAALVQRDRSISEGTEHRSRSLLRYLGAARYPDLDRTEAPPKPEKAEQDKSS